MSDVPEDSGKSNSPEEKPKEGSAGSDGAAGAGAPDAGWIYSGLPGTGYYPQAAPVPTPPPAPIAPPEAAPAAPEAATAPPPPMAPPATLRPAPMAAASKPAPEKPDERKPGDASLASVIDTIEAIIIALIIALTFRAFIVEAFVIPTGSMAPTLLGAHFKAVCPKCGYEFDYNANVSMQVIRDASGAYVPINPDRAAELRSNTNVPLLDSDAIFCPNCRYLISPRELPQYLGKTQLKSGAGGQSHDYSFAWANNGDRILVLKYLYAVNDPKRWDVIVFKEPQAADANFIKRLVGLPGETVQIINGNIFAGTGPGAEQDPKQRHIQRKPEEQQRYLWQLVYDNDFYPNDEGRVALAGGRATPLPHYQEPWTNPWEPQPAAAAGEWKKGTTMQYTGAGPGTLKFNLVPSQLPDYPPYTLNTLGYNGDFYFVDDNNANETPRSIVDDLRLEALWTPGENDGKAPSVKLTLGRPNNCYQFAWDASGMKLLKRSAQGTFVAVDAKILVPLPAPARGDSYRLAMNNVDRAVQVYVNEKKVMGYEEDWTAEEAIADITANPADWQNSNGNPIRSAEMKARANSIISVDVDGACSISHLKVYRDLYYTQVTQGPWPATGTMTNPVTLKQDQFFACGDNSRKSLDGRMWSSVYEPLGDLELPVGIVPRRYLLGKAFFVYWPAGYRASERLPVLQNLPLVPNTGSMRIIR